MFHFRVGHLVNDDLRNSVMIMSREKDSESEQPQTWVMYVGKA